MHMLSMAKNSGLEITTSVMSCENQAEKVRQFLLNDKLIALSELIITVLIQSMTHQNLCHFWCCEQRTAS